MASDFIYTCRDDDLTREKILLEQKKWGYKDIIPIEYSKKYTDFVNALVDEKAVVDALLLKEAKPNEAKIRSVEEAWKKMGLNLSVVRLLNPDSKLDYRTLDDDKCSDAVIKETYLQNPFKVPIEFCHDINARLFCYEVLSKEKVMDIICCCCYLPHNENRYASCIFAHEIMHSQLHRVKQGTNNYHNTELLPIFVEQILALSKSYKTFLKLYNYRLAQVVHYFNQIYLYKDMDYLDRCEFDKYIVSSIRALYLVKMFYFANDEQRSDMIQLVNNILSGRNTIEDLLDRYCITRENEEKNLSNIIRILK